MKQRNGLFRNTESSTAAIKDYQEIAKANGITTAQLALKWCDQIDGVTSTIIGATKMTQLKEDIDAFKAPLSEQALTDIQAVISKYPAPF